MENLDHIRQRLEKERDVLHRRIRNLHADQQKRDGPLAADLQEQAIELENDEVVDVLEPASRHQLRGVLAALERLEEGSYGVCVDCEQAIAPRRLEVRPSAIRCIECAEAAES